MDESWREALLIGSRVAYILTGDLCLVSKLEKTCLLTENQVRKFDLIYFSKENLGGIASMWLSRLLKMKLFFQYYDSCISTTVGMFLHVKA